MTDRPKGFGLSYAPARAPASTWLPTASFILAVVSLTVWLMLPRVRFAIIAILLLQPIILALGIAAVVRAKLDQWRGARLAFAALCVDAASIIVVLAPAYGPVLAAVLPRKTIDTSGSEAESSLQKELQYLGAHGISTHILRAGQRTGSPSTSCYLFSVEPGGAMLLKQQLVERAATNGAKTNDGDEALDFMPYDRQPNWFKPRVYKDADYLSVESKYECIFCPEENLVFLSKTSD